jgi:hypothetical protein
LRYCHPDGHSCRKQFSTRRILNAKLPEPGGGSMWSAEGNRASNTLTRRPATYNGIRIGARHCQRVCAHEQSSANPVMADAKSIAESQRKPGRRPKNHPPREPVLQVVGDLFQPFALSRRAGLDFFPFSRRAFHQSLHTLRDCLRASKLHLSLVRSLPACPNVNFARFFLTRCSGRPPCRQSHLPSLDSAVGIQPDAFRSIFENHRHPIGIDQN